MTDLAKLRRLYEAMRGDAFTLTMEIYCTQEVVDFDDAMEQAFPALVAEIEALRKVERAARDLQQQFIKNDEPISWHALSVALLELE